MTADETSSIEVSKNVGCFWPTHVYKRAMKEDPPADRLTKYKPKGAKSFTEGLWMYGPTDALAPGAINLVARQSQNLSKRVNLTEDQAKAQS